MKNILENKEHLSIKIKDKNLLREIFQKYSTNVSGVTLIVLGYLIFTDRVYILASFFQEIIYILNLDWLSSI